VTTPCDSAKTAQFSAGVSKRGAGFKGRHGDVLTLHDAMVQVLADQGSLRASEIATVINRLKLYTRADGFPVPGSQISARARKYPDLFVRSAGKIGMARVIGPHPTARQKSLPQHRGRKVPTGSALSDLQFWDLGSVKDLIERGIPGDGRLDHCGVYKLIVPPAYVPRFIHPDEAHAARNVIFPLPAQPVDATQVLNLSAGTRARAGTQFVLDYVVEADQSWRQRVLVTCECKKQHPIIDWLAWLRDLEWVPLRKGGRGHLNNARLALFTRHDPRLVEMVTHEAHATFLSFRRCSRQTKRKCPSSGEDLPSSQEWPSNIPAQWRNSSKRSRRTSRRARVGRITKSSGSLSKSLFRNNLRPACPASASASIIIRARDRYPNGPRPASRITGSAGLGERSE
jgi:hypothetical protein